MSLFSLPQQNHRRQSVDPDPGRRRLLVLAMAGLVQWSTAAFVLGQARGQTSVTPQKKATQIPPRVIIGRDPAKLPPAVADMRYAILSAVETGDIAELKHAIDLNELKPDFGVSAGSGSIAHLKALSGDGEGLELLAVLGLILESGWAAVPGGRDVENNRIYVWPYFAEIPLDQLKPVEEVALYRLVRPAEVKAMRAAGRWTWWRLSIGADGVWHSFTRRS